MQQPLRTASAAAATAWASLHAAVHVLAPLTVGTRKLETLLVAAAAVSMVRRFLDAAQEALGCLVLHLERGLSLCGQQEYELSAGGGIGATSAASSR